MSQLVLSPIVDRRVHIKNLVEMVKLVRGILVLILLNHHCLISLT